MAQTTDHLWRVLLTDWEAEAYVECWCNDKEAAEAIVRCLKKHYGGDVSIQLDPPKK